MTVICSAFEPFGGRPVNISQQVLQEAGVSFVSLPVVFGEAWEKLEGVIEKLRPQGVLALGEASGRDEFQFERIALNRRAARISDNKGQRPLYDEIMHGEVLALESLWPDDGVIERLQQKGHQVSISCHAGTYVCNDLYYHLLFNQRKLNYQASFLHVPESDDPEKGASLIKDFLQLAVD